MPDVWYGVSKGRPVSELETGRFGGMSNHAVVGYGYSFNFNADTGGVFIWNQDRRTTEGGVRELIGGSSPTAPIYLKEEPNQTGGMA